VHGCLWGFVRGVVNWKCCISITLNGSMFGSVQPVTSAAIRVTRSGCRGSIRGADCGVRYIAQID
jgi:hypothetical protein